MNQSQKLQNPPAEQTLLQVVTPVDPLVTSVDSVAQTTIEELSGPMVNLRFQSQAHAAKVEDGSTTTSMAMTPLDCDHHMMASFLPALELETLEYSCDYSGMYFLQPEVAFLIYDQPSKAYLLSLETAPIMFKPKTLEYNLDFPIVHVLDSIAEHEGSPFVGVENPP